MASSHWAIPRSDHRIILVGINKPEQRSTNANSDQHSDQQPSSTDCIKKRQRCKAGKGGGGGRDRSQGIFAEGIGRGGSIPQDPCNLLVIFFLPAGSHSSSQHCYIRFWAPDFKASSNSSRNTQKRELT